MGGEPTAKAIIIQLCGMIIVIGISIIIPIIIPPEIIPMYNSTLWILLLAGLRIPCLPQGGLGTSEFYSRIF